MLVPVTVRAVMNPNVETIGPEQSAIEAAERLNTRGIGSLIVVDGETPVGVLTESDMVRLLAEQRDASTVTVEECMAAPPITLSVDASLERAVELFREHDIKKLPVMDGDDLVGIVTTTDISYYLPHLSRQATERPPQQGATTSTRKRTRTRVDTAYENDDWTFESVGDREDHIDVGDVITFSKTLSEADVTAFAEASGDTNRLHLDAEYARGTRFGHPIAHGTLVAGTISAALARLPGLIIYLSQEVSYLGPVEIGDRVTATCEVVEQLGTDRYRLTTSVSREDGKEVIDGEAVVLADDIPDTA